VYRREKERGLPSMVMGKVSVEWLLATMEVEALVQGEGLKEFFKYSRVSSKAFLAQRCLNNHGPFLVLVEYWDGAWRGFIAIPKGREEGIEMLCH
jgi:hypothetical protein